MSARTSMSRAYTALAAVFVLGALLGCASVASIDKTYAIDPPTTVDRDLAVEGSAEDARALPANQIGTNTFSLLRTPIVPVSSAKPLEDQLMRNIRETLAEAGFTIRDDGYPRLHCRIDDFYFKDFTWLFPLYFFEGQIALTLYLTDEDGSVSWSRTFSATCQRRAGFVSFDPAIAATMRALLIDIQSACLADDFLVSLDHPYRPSAEEVLAEPPPRAEAAAIEVTVPQNTASSPLKVAVILPDTQTADPTLQTVARAIQDAVAIDLVLSGRYIVDRNDFLAPARDFARARQYLEAQGYDGAIWGLLSQGAEGIAVTLAAWKRGEKSPGVEVKEQGVAVLDTFDVADRLSLDVLERFTGVHMAMGTLRFRLTGDPVPYEVSVNGQVVGENLKSLRVPATTLRVRMTTRAGGREYAQDAVTASVPEDQAVEFSFDPASGIPRAAASPPPAARTKTPAMATPPAAAGLSSQSRLELESMLQRHTYRTEQGMFTIQPLAARLTPQDRRTYYERYSLRSALLVTLGNTFYGLGSWLQGDYLGGLLCTGCMIGGVLMAVLSLGDSDPLLAGGVVSVAVGLVYGWVRPFVFQNNNNKRLGQALYYNQ